MDFADTYKSKLMTAEAAATLIPSGTTMAMGMAMAEPPAILGALADRARTGGVEKLKLYYFEATSIAGTTVLDYALVDRIEPYCMFMTKADRDTVKRGLHEDRKVLRYVPNTFHQAPRLLSEEIGVESFVCAVLIFLGSCGHPEARFEQEVFDGRAGERDGGQAPVLHRGV